MTDDQQTEDQTESSGNAEAAKYRRQLREAEQERDALREQLQAHHRDRVHSALRGALSGLDAAAVDVLVDAADVDRFTAEDGAVDGEAVEAFAAPFTATVRPGPSDRRGWSVGPGSTGPASADAPASWDRVIR